MGRQSKNGFGRDKTTLMKPSKFISGNIYTITAIAFGLFETYRILQQQWSGDFWQHSAVVNELSKNLIHPGNPFILSDTPHAFYSPYSLLVAIFSRITGFGPIESLSFFAFFNLVFFLWAFWFFCRNIFRDHQQMIAALSLILVLFFTGEHPLLWSGFYHLFVFQYGLPYPSTFSMAVSFFVLGLLAKNNSGNSFLKYITPVLLCTVVFITHPTTGIFLVTAIFVLNFFLKELPLLQSGFRLALVILPALLLAIAWPYYRFTDLFLGNNADFHKDSMELYDDIFLHHWPVLLSLPSLFLFKKDRVTLFFAVTMVIMTFLYVAGYYTGSYGLGRLISNVLMFADLMIAYTIVRLCNYRNGVARFYALILVLCMLVSGMFNFKDYRQALSFARRDLAYYHRFRFLEKTIDRNAIVLADEGTSLMIPTFNGKVIAIRYPLYWIDDIQQRRKDLQLFFKNGTMDSTRIRIINQYKPAYILVDFRYLHPDSSLISFIQKTGATIYTGNQLDLVKLNSNR